MGKMYITEDQAQRLLKNRDNTYNRKAVKKQIFTEIRKQHGIPSGTKIKFFIESSANPDYRVIRNKHTGAALDNGIPDKVETPQPLVKAVSPAATPAKKPVAKKVVAKKVVAKKVAAKKVAAKPAAKKVVAKKPAAKPAAKKVVAKKVAAKPAAKKVVAKKPAAKKRG